MSSKLGRPTDNPKTYKITVRLDKEAETTLQRYCAQEDVERGEAIRRGIKKLADDLHEKE